MLQNIIDKYMFAVSDDEDIEYNGECTCDGKNECESCIQYEEIEKEKMKTRFYVKRNPNPKICCEVCGTTKTSDFNHIFRCSKCGLHGCHLQCARVEIAPDDWRCMHCKHKPKRISKKRKLAKDSFQYLLNNVCDP